MRLSALALCALGLASAHGAEHSASPRACVFRPRTQTAPKRPDTIFALILREQCRHAAALGPMNVRIEDPADDPSDDPVWGNESADSYPGDDPYPAAVRPGGARTLGEPTRGPATGPLVSLPREAAARPCVARALPPILDAEPRRGPPAH